MDHAVLVDLDVKAGQRVVDALVAEKVDFEVAIVASLEDYYHPRLIFAAKWLEEYDPAASYDKFGDVLRKAGGEQFNLDLRLMKLADPFIVDLRNKLKKYAHPEGLRLDGRVFGGKYVEDGYVYRVK